MRISFFRGGFAATLLAGPIYLLMVLLSSYLLVPDAVGLPDGNGLVFIVPLAIASLVFGSMLAVFPIWLGGAVLGWASARNPGLAHPACWMLAGGAMAAAVAIWADPTLAPPSIALIPTGAICAVIVRYGTRWSDALNA